MRFLVLMPLMLLSVFAQAETVMGKVVGVSDGDTIRVVTADKRLYKIRAAEIDAPEKDAPWGQRSKQALSALVFGKEVQVDIHERDRYGRSVATIYINGLSANESQVKNGHAWAYRQYLKSKRLIDLEAKARQAKVGLWSLPVSEQIPPWEWRKSKRQGVKPTATLGEAQPAGKYDCGIKKSCKAMTSCDEATFYLKHCGQQQLDGDGDGRPCSNVCRR